MPVVVSLPPVLVMLMAVMAAMIGMGTVVTTRCIVITEIDGCGIVINDTRLIDDARGVMMMVARRTNADAPANVIMACICAGRTCQGENAGGQR